MKSRSRPLCTNDVLAPVQVDGKLTCVRDAHFVLDHRVGFEHRLETLVSTTALIAERRELLEVRTDAAAVSSICAFVWTCRRPGMASRGITS